MTKSANFMYIPANPFYRGKIPKPENTGSRELRIGYSWNPQPLVKPCLLCAMETRGFLPPVGALYHSQWALDLSLTDGIENRVRYRSSKWVRRASQIAHLYRPLTPYWERIDNTNAGKCSSAFILFEGGELAGLSNLLNSRTGHARILDPAGTLAGLLLSAAEIGKRLGETGFWQAQAVLCRILNLLRECQPLDKNTWTVSGLDNEAGREFSRGIESYLKDHLSAGLTLDVLARHAGVSLSTLSHRYRGETGETPFTTLIRLRITMAKSLLLKGWRLKEIAEQTGFSDGFHLSHTFKRVEGQSPRQFLTAIHRRTLP